MTFSSLSVYIIFMDPHQGNNNVMSFSIPTTKAYVEFIGRKKARAYLQCIYCKVKQRIQRESFNQIKMCMCVDIYGG
jgi:poly-D-alanine transfer protein DltD